MGTENVKVAVHHKQEEYPVEFKKILEYVKSIKFGSVTLQIEDGKIIQIDRNEKIRFDKK